MAASSDHSARARIWVAFLLLFVVLAAVSVGVYYLGKLQETMAALEGRIALDAAVEARRPRSADEPRVLALEQELLAAV